MNELPPTECQNARFAIEGCIEYGRQGINPPPDNHWLVPFWSIGRQLSENADLRAEVEQLRVPTEEMVSVCLQRFRKEIDIHMDTNHPSASPGHDAMRIAMRAAFAARKESANG